MADFILYIGTAIALVFVIEGLLYALFPDAIRRMMAYAITIPVNHLRLAGLGMACAGFLFVFLIAQFL